MSFADIWQNPILLRTQQQSARVRRTPWIILAILVIVTLLVAAIGGVAAETGDPATVGTGIYGTFFMIAAFFVMMIGAFLAGHGLSSEHQGRTWEMLLLTGMTPRRIVIGKLVSALANVMVYLVALSPIAAVAFVFGGVSAIEVALGFGFLTGLGVLSVAFGLAVGSAAPQHGAVWAIAVMFMLFVPAAPLAGVTGALVIHLIWPALHIDTPIWWPAMAARAPIDLRYFLFVWAFPLGAFALPSWLGVELAVAHVAEPGSDRFASFKRALLISVAVVCALCSAAVLAARNVDEVAPALMLGYLVHSVLSMALFALAGDDVYAFRRARHDLRAASPLRRLLGPSVVRGSIVFLVAWLLSLVVVSSVTMVQFARFSAPSRRLSEVLLTCMTSIPFVIFSGGLLAFFRSRRQTPLVARLLTIVTGCAVSGVPWVIYAIVGGISDSEHWVVLGAPSPAYLGAMLRALDDGTGGTTDAQILILGVGVAAAGFYLVFGMVLFWLSARRTGDALDAELAYEREVEARLAEEDRSLAAEAT